MNLYEMKEHLSLKKVERWFLTLGLQRGGGGLVLANVSAVVLERPLVVRSGSSLRCEEDGDRTSAESRWFGSG